MTFECRTHLHGPTSLKYVVPKISVSVCVLPTCRKQLDWLWPDSWGSPCLQSGPLGKLNCLAVLQTLARCHDPIHTHLHLERTFLTTHSSHTNLCTRNVPMLRTDSEWTDLLSHTVLLSQLKQGNQEDKELNPNSDYSDWSAAELKCTESSQIVTQAQIQPRSYYSYRGLYITK